MRNKKSSGQHRGRGGSHKRRHRQPNILVIFADEVGMTNVSAYTHGLVGYRTPNIDRIAHEGILFTDYYGEQSGVGGRVAFATGQSIIRSGLGKVGAPGVTLGIRAEDPTIAELLKPLGYTTGQFGTNQVADSDKAPPTMRGGDDLLVLVQDWIKQQSKARRPWFCWVNTPPVHPRAHDKAESSGSASRGQSMCRDAVGAHDRQVGALLDLLDDLDLVEETIAVYAVASGPQTPGRAGCATTPFRSMNDTTREGEGAFRVPALIRWPGKIEAGSVSNDIISHLDLLPTIVAAGGDPEIKEKLLRGHTAGPKTFKVHLDGYDLVPYLTGKEAKCPRQEFFYFSDDGDLLAMRYADWKLVFLEQHPGMFQAWTELLLTPLFSLPVSSASTSPFVQTHAPKLFNLRADPYELAGTSNARQEWTSSGASLLVPTQARLTHFLDSFREFPPHLKPASFTADRALGTLTFLRSRGP